jgi:hypothetical protein
MSEEPDDDLIEPGIFLRLRRFAAWFFLAIMLLTAPTAVWLVCGVVLVAHFRNMVVRGLLRQSRAFWGKRAF